MPSLKGGPFHQGLFVPSRRPEICGTKQESYTGCAYQSFPHPTPTTGRSGSHATTCTTKHDSSVRGWSIVHPHYDGGRRRSCHASQELRYTTRGRTICSRGFSIIAAIQWPSHIREDHFRGTIPSLQRDTKVHT